MFSESWLPLESGSDSTITSVASVVEQEVTGLTGYPQSSYWRRSCGRSVCGSSSSTSEEMNSIRYYLLIILFILTYFKFCFLCKDILGGSLVMYGAKYICISLFFLVKVYFRVYSRPAYWLYLISILINVRNVYYFNSLNNNNNKNIFTSSYLYLLQTNNEWTVVKREAEIRSKYYSCCLESFPDFIVTLTLRRNPLFYVHVFIIPALLIGLLVPFHMLLPPDSSERITLGESCSHPQCCPVGT